jgi:hypothetical protein
LKQEYIILFTRKKKKKTKQAYKVKECRLVVVVRSLRRKECGEAQEPRKSSSSRSKWRRRSSKKREERVASLCALAGNRAASSHDCGPGRRAGKHLRACQCSEEERSDGLGFREG